MSTSEPSTWTEPKIDLLRTLSTQGLSTAQIGRRLQISKNAVVGKVHRLQLPGRKSPFRRSSKPPAAPGKIPEAVPPAAARPKLAVSPDPAPEVSAPASPPLPGVAALPERAAAAKTIWASTSQFCQWPNGDPGRSRFHLCGDPVEAGKVYCAPHCKRAYRRPSTADAV